MSLNNDFKSTSGFPRFNGNPADFMLFSAQFKGIIYELGDDYIDAFEGDEPYQDCTFKPNVRKVRATTRVPRADVRQPLSGVLEGSEDQDVEASRDANQEAKNQRINETHTFLGGTPQRGARSQLGPQDLVMASAHSRSWKKNTTVDQGPHEAL